jgi:hypothetical protein
MYQAMADAEQLATEVQVLNEALASLEDLQTMLASIRLVLRRH